VLLSGTGDLVGWSPQNGASLPVVAIPSAKLGMWRVRRDVERSWLTLMCRSATVNNRRRAGVVGHPQRMKRDSRPRSGFGEIKRSTVLLSPIALIFERKPTRTRIVP
jgi:hypothetical protein